MNESAVLRLAPDRERDHSLVDRAVSWAGNGFDKVAYFGLRRLFNRRRLPEMSPEELDRSLSMLSCYSDPEVLADPDRLMKPPAGAPQWTARWRRRVRGGSHSHFTFPTCYRPVHPIYANEYKRYDRIDTAHLYAWQHETSAKGSILLTHGWGAGQKSLHVHEFGVPYLFQRLGLDVYFYVAPFHGVRKPSQARYSGELHPSSNLMRTNEAFVQTAQEIRYAIAGILAHNDAPLGMMGSSLGGYTSALIASIDDRLSFVVPVIPPPSLAELFWEQGSGDATRKRAERMGMTLERFRHAWALHTPLTYACQVPWEGRMLVSASGDAMVTAKHVERLWHHWGRPKHVRFPGGHILQVGRRRYHRELGGFLANLGIVDRARVAR